MKKRLVFPQNNTYSSGPNLKIVRRVEVGQGVTAFCSGNACAFVRASIVPFLYTTYGSETAVSSDTQNDVILKRHRTGTVFERLDRYYGLENPP